MLTIYSKVFYLLFIALSVSSSNARPNVARQKLFGIIEGSLKECMGQYNKTWDQVMDMEDAEDPDDANACFVGCMMINEGLITETGQLNKTIAEAKMTAMEDVDEKALWNDFFDELANDLEDAKDACSAGETTQDHLYYMKHMKTFHDEEEIMPDDHDEDHEEDHDGHDEEEEEDEEEEDGDADDEEEIGEKDEKETTEMKN